MNFLIADTFTDSLARLTGDEQKAVKTTAFDLQINPDSPGMSFHKLDRARDKNFWSVRVTSDLRLIVHRTTGSLLLCYVGHHDKAYDWAQRRRLETHPITGAAQLVEVHETVQEIVVPSRSLPMQTATDPPIFAGHSSDELLGYGVPADWIEQVKSATQDEFLGFYDHLPAEAAEALLEIATGGKPRAPQVQEPTSNPFDHPDAKRRFRVLSSVEELQRALEFPWDKWTIFLHPEQRQWVEHDFSGPARISGSAGTGKTIVALHRAVFLTHQAPNARILISTYSEILAADLRSRLRRLVANEPRLAERIDVYPLDEVGAQLYRAHVGKVMLAPESYVDEILRNAALSEPTRKFTHSFIASEWYSVVDAWQITTWDEYKDCTRIGRKSRISEQQRALIWSIFEDVRTQLRHGGYITNAEMFVRLANALANAQHPPYDYAIVDEAQDINISHLRFFAAVAGNRANGLFFAADIGQRIFQSPFSWKSLGVDIRGRSKTLRVNYRTSREIRTQADKLLDPEISDFDGNLDTRSDTISLFNGPKPFIEIFDSQEDERQGACKWLQSRLQDGIAPAEIAVFVRSGDQLERAASVLTNVNVPYTLLGQGGAIQPNSATVGTMHEAKGLEFRCVLVLACDDDVIPLQSRIESVAEEGELREIYDTERHLMYVACTRARDCLFVSGVAPASEFLDDLKL